MKPPAWRVILGAAVMRRRAAAGLTQAQLARRARLAQGTIAVIERGASVRDETLKTVACALECWPRGTP